MLLAVTGCVRGGDGGKLEDDLKGPMSRIYGPIDSVSCSKNENREAPGGGAAYDCTLNLQSGAMQVVCAGQAKGVPLFERTRCDESGFPSR
jgi:hypothetical protein